MPMIQTTVQCAVPDSFRVGQVAGMFDLPPSSRASRTFSVEIPSADEPWTSGAIVGPSGSGKTTIARQAFGESIYTEGGWSPRTAVIDGFGDVSTRTITQMLTAVGLSSPPSWVKPYAVLSRGEQFRCDLARALLTGGPLVVFDEFTSVVDRTVAKIGSAAVSKAVRNGKLNKRLVVVTCHYDILEWLQPDWTVDMGTCTLKRGRLRRPGIALEIFRCARAAWELFAPHHYLSGSLSTASTCYLALWDGRPVAFCAVIALYGFKGRRRIHRVVTLPDYQGVGVGTSFLEQVCQLERNAGRRINITSSHPAIIGYCKNSPRWRTVAVAKTGRRGRQLSKTDGRLVKSSHGRSVVSFEYVGEVKE